MWILPRSTRALISISINTFPSHYSTLVAADVTTISKKKDNLMADYLFKTIGLSMKDAISVSSKVSHLKSTQNPNSVINFFKIYGGLNKSQIKDVVFSAPHVLTHKADQNLESKFRVLKEFGLSGVKLVKFIKKQPHLFDRGLDTNIVPTLSFLAEFLGGCTEDLFIALCRAPWLMGSNVRLNLEPNLLLFKDFGFSEHELRKFFVSKPRAFMQKPTSLQNVIERVERKLGIPRESKTFIRGVFALTDASDVMVEKKVSVFRSFGWSDSDIFTLFRTLPQCAAISEEKIRNALTFLMKELGYEPMYLASLPALLTCSLEKRVKPRYEV